MPARGWLRAVREGTGLTQAEVARKAAMKRQSFAQFEAAECKGAITLGSLKRAAEAMDCELVYFIVPRPSVAPSYAALADRDDGSASHQRATDHSMALGGEAPPDHGV